MARCNARLAEAKTKDASGDAKGAESLLLLNLKEWRQDKVYSKLSKQRNYAEIGRRPEIQQSAIHIEHIASFYFVKGRWADAEKYFDLACQRLEAVYGIGVPLVFQCFKKFQAVHERLGNTVVARELAEQLQAKQAEVERMMMAAGHHHPGMMPPGAAASMMMGGGGGGGGGSNRHGLLTIPDLDVLAAPFLAATAKGSRRMALLRRAKEFNARLLTAEAAANPVNPSDRKTWPERALLGDEYVKVMEAALALNTKDAAVLLRCKTQRLQALADRGKSNSIGDKQRRTLLKRTAVVQAFLLGGSGSDAAAAGAAGAGASTAAAGAAG
eukprot:g4300.t1